MAPAALANLRWAAACLAPPRPIAIQYANPNTVFGNPTRADHSFADSDFLHARQRRCQRQLTLPQPLSGALL